MPSTRNGINPLYYVIDDIASNTITIDASTWSTNIGWTANTILDEIISIKEKFNTADDYSEPRIKENEMKVDLDEVFNGLNEENKTKINEVK